MNVGTKIGLLNDFLSKSAFSDHAETGLSLARKSAVEHPEK